MGKFRSEVRRKIPRIVQVTENFFYEEIAFFVVAHGDESSSLPGEAPQGWREILYNTLLETCNAGPCNYLFSQPPRLIAELCFKPGVTDNLGNIATQALQFLPRIPAHTSAQVHSGQLVILFGSASKAEMRTFIERSKANPLLHSIAYCEPEEFYRGSRFQLSQPKVVPVKSTAPLRYYDLNLPSDALASLSKEHCWALSTQELQHIRAHYADSLTHKKRQAQGLSPQPCDIEMEAIAQSWSEHCKHKIFAADITYSEADPEKWPPALKRLGPLKINSLYRTYIKGATAAIKRTSPHADTLISVFSDNAGIVRFDAQVDVCIKVETHNSPSALDPYGGALTGILGVNRDILGCGLGAKPIANTDIFCLAPPDWPAREDAFRLPLSLHHPQQILTGVHRGIADGGNKSGIPTINGAMIFDRDYAGKPLIFCGSVGVMPQQLADGRPTHLKEVCPGDLIFCAGGRIGKDGIHGATMSSLHLGEDSPTTAVQIGDPFTQKKLLDFTLEARDLGLFRCITDNGAGGLSSSVGELAALAPGARLDLARAGVKYPGLQPYELLISESQERMTYGVPPEKSAGFMALASQRGVEAWELGEFTSSGQFEILYDGKLLASLDLHFLHESLPPMQLEACFKGPEAQRGWGNEILQRLPLRGDAIDFSTILCTLLQAPNVRSKEAWVRQYDHGVQGAAVQRPFVGPRQEGPGDGGVLALAPYGGEQHNAIALACGCNPKLAHYDTYLMALNAVDEALRNIVAVGGDPAQTVLVDNFCWPDPLPGPHNAHAAHKLGQLVRCAVGLYDAALIFASPFVSGKDSMKNDFIGKYADGTPAKISVPPTVLVSAMARVKNSQRTVSSEFKQAGDVIFLLGAHSAGLGCSEFAGYWEIAEESLQLPPGIDLRANQLLYSALHTLIAEGLIASCHDVSDGGVLPCVAESAIGGNLGANLLLDTYGEKWDLVDFCFNEAGGRLVISVDPQQLGRVTAALGNLPLRRLGVVSAEAALRVRGQEQRELFSLRIDTLKQAWQGDH